MLNLEGLSEAQRGQIEAALTVALKGKLLMTAPCPRCDRAKVLFEKIYSDDTIRHECRSCGYFMVWKPRRTGVHEQVNPNTWRMEFYNREAFTRRVYPD